MRFEAVGVAIVALCLATPSLAAGQFYCAADDDNLKLSIESDFADDRGQRLVDFRGVLSMQDPTAPPLLKHFALKSQMLTQYWVDPERLQLRLFSEGTAPDSYTAIDLSIDTAAGADTPERLVGQYFITTTASPAKLSPQKEKASHSGRLTCEFK